MENETHPLISFYEAELLMATESLLRSYRTRAEKIQWSSSAQQFNAGQFANQCEAAADGIFETLNLAANVLRLEVPKAALAKRLG